MTDRDKIFFPVFCEDPELFRFDLQLFAAEDEGRTEDPTEKKLREAREKGQVAKTQELPQAVVVIVGCLVIFIFSSWIYDSLAGILRHYLSGFAGKEITMRNIRFEFFMLMFESGKILLPVFAAVFFSAIAAEASQVGFQMSPLKFDWNKIKLGPAEMMKKIFFSKQVAMNLFKSLFKVIAIGFVSYLIISADFEDMMRTPDISIQMAVKIVMFSALKIVVWSSVLLLVLSIPDYFFQKHEFIESLKMKKQEVKEELKETMGDPYIRARMREMQREIAMRNMISEVPKADVIVTNPTHFAIALKYDNNLMDAPVVAAKGVDSMALKIREIARQHSIEMIENKPLARELYYRLDVGEMIPEDLFKAVSFIYAELYKRDKKLKKVV